MMPEWLVAVTTRIVMAILAVLCFLFGCAYEADSGARAQRSSGKLQGDDLHGRHGAGRKADGSKTFRAREASAWPRR